LQKGLNKTILMVTHDPRAAARAARILHLEKGKLVHETGNNDHGPVDTNIYAAPGVTGVRP
jgi:ABC-type transport system involved in cytochrome bd biosynthesis fused ATPase/permease subunit